MRSRQAPSFRISAINERDPGRAGSLNQNKEKSFKMDLGIGDLPYYNTSKEALHHGEAFY